MSKEDKEDIKKFKESLRELRNVDIIIETNRFKRKEGYELPKRKR